MAIPTIPDIRTLMEAGVHFGHASGKWHPKMKPYIFATRDKLHIINLEKTQQQLAEVLPILEQRIREGKTVVLVGTKRQVANRVQEIGEKLTIPYVNVRWLGGTMTNFKEIQKSINRMKKMEAFLASEDSATLIKKERVMQEQELARMKEKFGGLRDMNRKPDALFVIDPSHEHNAVKEARCEGIEIFAIIDTNSDPSLVNHLIPSNDDGAKALKIMLDLVEQTIENGQKLISVKGNKEEVVVAEEEEEIRVSATLVDEKEEIEEAVKAVEDSLVEEVAEESSEVLESKEAAQPETAQPAKAKAVKSTTTRKTSKVTAK